MIPLDYAVILWSVALGVWLQGEVPDPGVLVGAGLVVAAGLTILADRGTR